LRRAPVSFTIDNGANIVQADNMAFSDQLPAGLEVADTPGVSNSCGGAFSPAAGDTTLTFTDGTLDAGATCEIQVAVRAIEAGTLINPGIDLTSSIATATSNPATLTVNAAAGTVTFNVESDTNGAFSFASAAPVLTTAVEVSGGAASTGALRVATGSYSVAVTVPAGVILTAITCDDTDSTADLSTATISVTVDAFEDVTCMLTRNPRFSAQSRRSTAS